MKMKKWLGIFLALFVLVGVVLVPTTTASAGGGDSEMVVDVSLKIITVDSRVGGGYWAQDAITRNIKIWETGEGSFLAIITDVGTFTSWAGPSPNATGTIGDGVTGTIIGGYTVTMNGNFSPSAATSGHLGTFDYGCDQAGNCPNALDWRNLFFSSWSGFSYQSWGWTYDTCGNGSWNNAAGGNSGDITGEAVACAKPMRVVVKGLYAVVNPVDGKICYILSYGDPGPDDFERLCFTESDPDWWEGAGILASGDVYDNGTRQGFWPGDYAVRAYSNAGRPSLRHLKEVAKMYPWTQQ